MDTINEIKKLKELLDEGIITKEDFEKQKQKVLGIISNEESIEKEKIEDNVEEQNKMKSINDYEKELIEQLEKQQNKENEEGIEQEAKEEIIRRENQELYEKERLKEKAKLDAKAEQARERNTKIKQNVDKGVGKGIRIFKWVMAIALWLLGVGGIGAAFTNGIVYIFIGIEFFLLGVMACPKITDYTEKFKIYTKFKWLIVIIVVILFIVCACAFQ